MSEAEDRMAKSAETVRGRVTVSALRPKIGNVAASVSPNSHQAATTQPKEIDDEIPHDLAFKIALIGAGQGGGRIAQAFWELGYRRVAAFNTTDMDFKGLDDKMLKLSLNVGGASKDTDLAKKALRGREEDVRDLLTRAWGKTYDCALVCASLGGGTGSGTAPELVKIVRKQMQDAGLPSRVGVIVSLPTVTEGFQVCRNAVTGFQELVELNVSPLIVIDNARINELYHPAMAELHGTANTTVSQMLHLFNQLAAVHSQYITFDRSEFAQILDSGLVTFGSSEIPRFDTPADVSTAIRDQLTKTVLAQVDLRTGRKAACLFVGSPHVLGSLGLEYFEAGYSQIDRVIGSAYAEGSSTVQTVLHRGLYEGDEEGLQCYCMIGQLELPRQRLSELAKRGGLYNGPNRSKVAEFLGVNDANPPTT